MATPQQALAKLRSDPGSFLKNYYVRIDKKPNVSGETDFWFGGVIGGGKGGYLRTARPDEVLGTLRMHESKNYKFTPRRESVIGSPAQVRVWYVDVTESATVVQNRIPSLAVSRRAGPDIMVTMLLTGCTFVYEPTPHCVLMAHMKPAAGQPPGEGARLETAIMNSYMLSGGLGFGKATAFGAGRAYTSLTEEVTIIGVRSQEQWRLFAQYHPRAGDNMRSVTQVVEFFNG